MVNQPQIARLIEYRDARQLVSRVLANGRCRSQAVREMLTRSDAVHAASLGLALQRLCEITYAPAPLSERLAQQIVEMQTEQGWFGGSGAVTLTEAQLAASAVAARGLQAFIAQQRSRHTPIAASAVDSLERFLEALESRVHRIPPCEHDAVGWAIVLWQLGDSQELRSRIDVDEILRSLDELGVETVEDELCRYAHAMAA